MPNFRKLALLLLLPSAGVLAQPLPITPDELPALREASEINPKIQALGEPWTVDIHSREEVRQFYRSVYSASNSVPSEWNGDTSSGNAGTTSDAFKAAVMDRINFYRAMAGVPAVIQNNTTFSAKAQQAALIMSANGGLSHNPADENGWVHVTADGDEAAGKSNIGIGTRGPDTIDGYMRDHGAGNESVGHRRWLFHAPTQEMGTGDVEAQGGFQSANALWVQDAQIFGSRPATREEFVAWPPKGKVPAPLVWSRWSFSMPGANFSNATVTMTRDGSPISADLNAIVGASALDPIIVWRYDGTSGNSLESHPTPSADVDYEVTISNVNIGGSSRNFTYTVTVFDPDTPGSDFNDSIVSGPSTAGTGGPSEFTVTVPAFASGFIWRELNLVPLSVTFGAEGGLQGLVDGTNAGYSARATSPTASGNGAYHLTHIEQGEETLTLPDRYIISASGSPALNFASRIGFASADQVAHVQVSTNGGTSWSTVYEQAGTSNGSSPTESSFQNRSVDLSAFAGRTIKLRFLFAFSNGNFFNSGSTNTGWLIDDIELDGAQIAQVLNTSAHTTGTTFDYTASSTGAKGLQVRGAFFGSYPMDWGTLFSVTADSGSGSGSSGGGGGNRK